MGTINFHLQGQYLVQIKDVLRRRGLRPDLNRIWEIHGPHQFGESEVLVGYAYDQDQSHLCVAISPRAVYNVQEPILWWNRLPSHKIAVIKRLSSDHKSS